MPLKEFKIEDILHLTAHYCSAKEQKSIKDAFLLAQEVHKDKKRGTGEPFIQHPLHVTYYLAKNELDATTLCAALLHDVEEEKPQSIIEIQQIFGTDVANLVKGVTKLGKIKIKKSWFFPIKLLQDNQRRQMGFSRHIESLRKMLLAMSKDIRVIIIKFADRLHNMQTLKGIKSEKQRRIAQETLEIYAPMAYRLGMGYLKGELEDLAFPFVYPKEYQETVKLAGKSYHHKERYINLVKEKIFAILAENNITASIDGRKKHLYSLWKKLRRNDNNIGKIYDIVALRIVVNDLQDCYKVLGLIHKNFRPLIGRIKDYIAVPKPNGYQSLHTTIFLPEGEIIEIQIRTKEMHEKAEFGIAAHWHYKEDKKSKLSIDKNQIGWLNELASWQDKLSDDYELKRGLVLDFFKDRIFCFTPQGDVIDLPQGATPVDFAYSVHTEVGNYCIGAKVNSKIVKLNQPLINGDIVEVITSSKSPGPKRDWLKFVVTQRARHKIKSLSSNSLIGFK